MVFRINISAAGILYPAAVLCVDDICGDNPGYSAMKDLC